MDFNKVKMGKSKTEAMGISRSPGSTGGDILEDYQPDQSSALQCLGVLWNDDTSTSATTKLNFNKVVRDDLFFWSGSGSIVVFSKADNNSIDEAIRMLFSLYTKEMQSWNGAFIETDNEKFANEVFYKSVCQGIKMFAKKEANNYSISYAAMRRTNRRLAIDIAKFKDMNDSANKLNLIDIKRAWHNALDNMLIDYDEILADEEAFKNERYQQKIRETKEGY